MMNTKKAICIHSFKQRIMDKKPVINRITGSVFGLLIFLVLLCSNVSANNEILNPKTDKADSVSQNTYIEGIRTRLNGNVTRVKSRLIYEEQVLEEKQSTGFFVSTDRPEAYLVTTYQISFSKEDIDHYYDQIKSSLSEEDQHKQIEIIESYEVCFNGDIKVNAQRTSVESKKSDVLVLCCPEISNSDNALLISSVHEEVLESVCMAGYSAECSNDDVYDDEHISLNEGVVAKARENDDAISFAVVLPDFSQDEPEFAGAPILNEEGEVTGIYNGIDENHYVLALTCNSLKQMFQLQGIQLKQTEHRLGGKRPVYIYIFIIVAALLGILLFVRLARTVRQKDQIAGFFQKKDKNNIQILRVSTNEQIKIDKTEFYFGTDESKCDYVITGNKACDPVQFCIISENRNKYIVCIANQSDLYLNNRKLKRSRKTRIKNGMIIHAGDERYMVIM